MTPEMIEKARANAAKKNYYNVEFRLGEIEHLPVADNSVDVVISNCVINLSPDKESVFREACRVLKPGGRIMVSDIVLSKELPDFIRDSADAYVSCISGAITKDQYLKTVTDAGFSKVDIVKETSVPVDEWLNDPVTESITKKLKISSEEAKELLGTVMTISVQGVK
jgi:ubiquinone/menaquinone biosynthesis C-methylase UbiE